MKKGNRRQFLDEDLLKNNKNGAQAEADTVDSWLIAAKYKRCDNNTRSS